VSQLLRLVEIIAQLRGPDGCPWDQAQDLATMRPYLLEETYEVLDAMEAGGESTGEGITGELGDLLFVVLLLARITEEDGRGGLEDVARGICEKMITRHPHVFGSGADSDDPGGIAAWEARKQKEGRSRLDGVPRTLPALLRAHRQAEKAAAVGFDWPSPDGVLAKIREEIGELEAALSSGEEAEIAHEYGDLLLAMANLGRHIGAPPEGTLRLANDRFSRRFGRLEELARDGGLLLHEATDPAALESLWEQAKAEEN
jgi:MazG family protein